MKRHLLALAALGTLALGGCATYGYDTYGTYGYNASPAYGYTSPAYGYDAYPSYSYGYYDAPYYTSPGVVVAPSFGFSYWGSDHDGHAGEWRDRGGRWHRGDDRHRGDSNRGDDRHRGDSGRDWNQNWSPNYQPAPNASADRQRQNAWDRGEPRQLPQESRGGEAGM